MQKRINIIELTSICTYCQDIGRDPKVIRYPVVFQT